MTTPWALKRKPLSVCKPPSKLASPPSTRAVAPAKVRLCCVKSMRALAPAISGVAADKRTSFPASTRRPLTTDNAASWVGISSCKDNSALPDAVVSRSTWPVQPVIGVLLT